MKEAPSIQLEVGASSVLGETLQCGSGPPRLLLATTHPCSVSHPNKFIGFSPVNFGGIKIWFVIGLYKEGG